MLQNSTSYNTSAGTENTEACNNNNTQSIKAPSAGEKQVDYDTKSSVFKKLNISQDRAVSILKQCDRRIADSWISTQPVLTAEVAQFYEVSKQEVVAASNKYSGELESQVSCQFSPRDVLHVGMFLDSPVATVMRVTLIDFVEAWGKESKRDRILKLLESENISKWSDVTISRLAGCSRSYVSKLREEKPENIEARRGDNVVQMKRRKKKEGKSEPENDASSPQHVNIHMVQDELQDETQDITSSLTSEPEKLKTIKRVWSQEEYEESINRIKDDHRKELMEVEKRITERIGSQFEQERLKEVIEEKEQYKKELEKALTQVDILQAKSDEIDKLQQLNSQLSQQIEDLAAELQRKQANSSQEIITKKAEELMRQEYRKQFGDINPEYHLQALAVKQPSIETPQQKAFLKRIMVSAIASVALLFPNSNIEKAAATALDVEPEKIEATARHLNRVGEGVSRIRECIVKINCSKEEFEKCVEPYQNIKKHIWVELSDIDKNRIKEILNKVSKSEQAPSNEADSSLPNQQPTPAKSCGQSPLSAELRTFSNPWEESKTWQFQGRVAKYDADNKTLSWGLQLKKIDLSMLCDEWESPQVWLMNYAGSQTKKNFDVGDKVMVCDRDSRYFEQAAIVDSVDGDWYKCMVGEYLVGFYVDDLNLN